MAMFTKPQVVLTCFSKPAMSNPRARMRPSQRFCAAQFRFSL